MAADVLMGTDAHATAWIGRYGEGRGEGGAATAAAGGRAGRRADVGRAGRRLDVDGAGRRTDGDVVDPVEVTPRP